MSHRIPQRAQSLVAIVGRHVFRMTITAAGVLTAALLIFGIASAEDLLILQRQDYLEAIALREQADLKFQQLLDKSAAARRERRELDIRPDAEELIRLYKSVTERFPLTEIGAYCEHRLAGAYQQIGEYDTAVQTLYGAYQLYSATSEAPEFAQSLGIMLLQAKNDPETAIKWLELIPAPREIESPEGQAAFSKFFGAQQALLRCEIQLERNEAAASRVKSLIQQYPRFQANIEQDYQFLLRAAQSQPKNARQRQAPEGQASPNPVPPKPAPAREPTPQELAFRLLEQQVRQLRTVKPGPDMDAALEGLSQQRDAAVDTIERLCPELAGDFGWVHTSVRVLERVNSEKSRALLKKLALGEIQVPQANLQSWAAGALLRCDKSQARSLLASRTDEVLETALIGLREAEIDEALMKELRPHIQSANSHTRFLAALAISRGSPAELAWPSILEAIRKVEEIPNLDAMDPSSGYHSDQLTTREANLFQFISVLGQVKVSEAVIREASKGLSGRTRDILLLGLAFRGDASVHDDIVRIAHDPDAGLFRGLAASSLEKIGTPEDLPLLRKLVESDPLVREGGGMVRLTGGGANYPVRRMAKQAVGTIERRTQRK